MTSGFNESKGMAKIPYVNLSHKRNEAGYSLVTSRVKPSPETQHLIGFCHLFLGFAIYQHFSCQTSNFN